MYKQSDKMGEINSNSNDEKIKKLMKEWKGKGPSFDIEYDGKNIKIKNIDEKAKRLHKNDPSIFKLTHKLFYELI